MSKLVIVVASAAASMASAVVIHAAVSTTDISKAAAQSRAPMDPTVMMERAPRNLPVERFDAL